jgi:eukaryotic-like serine/threonine-protein kinase
MTKAISMGTVVANRYRVLRIFGCGSFDFFEAEDTQTQKTVVLEVFHIPASASSEAPQRVLIETSMLRRICHPNLVEVIDVVHERGAIFVVAERLEGESLRDILGRGALSMSDLIALLIPAMRGVAEVHRQGTWHGKIRPGSIFVSTASPGRPHAVKVLDLVSGKIESLMGDSLTHNRLTMGDVHYMSLEQLYGGYDLDGRVDVHAFGAVLYEALTGRRPFEAEGFPEVAIKVLTETPVAPRLLRHDIPPALEQVILRAMARHREERFPTLDALISELEPFASATAYPAQTLAGKRSPTPFPTHGTWPRGAEPTVPASWSRWRLLLPLFAAVGVLIGLACRLVFRR